MRAILQIAALVCVVSLAHGQTCETGYTELNGACFRVSKNAGETQLTWFEARQACLLDGGDLATLRSQDDQDLIIQLAVDIGLEGYTIWHGMNQLADKTGDFTWADGATDTFEDWANNEPRDGGITNCGFTLTGPVAGDFQRYDYSSATYGLLDPGYDRPTDADGIDTFYFGGGWDKDWDWCEQQCAANSRCYGYTWYTYHWDYYWEYTCVGRSDRWDILQYDSYAYAGVRQSVGESGVNYWYAGNCGLLKGVACRKAPGSDTPVTVPPTQGVDGYCPDGYIGVGNKCLRVLIIDDELDGYRWQEAVIECRRGPGLSPDIASIHSHEENALITQYLQQTSYGLWIGYHYASLHDEWVWADNTEPRFTNWAEGEPGDTSNLCVEMWATPFTAGEWHNTRCDGRRGFVCQTYKDPDNVIATAPVTTPHVCTDGWTPYWYGCYRLDSTARSWSSARDNCVSLGGNLVSIHHEAENAAVFIMGGNQFPVWIGLQTNEDGFYEWVDGWPYGYYMNWDEDGVGGGEGCVAMKSNQKWEDTVCGNTYASVCKQTDEPVPTTPEGGGGYCPLGNWKEFGNNCYYFSTSTFEHQDAVADCRLQAGTSHSGNLASVENSYENEFILDNIRSDPYNYGSWIGLVRSQLGLDGFVWLDGSDSTFRNWAPGEPSDPYYENCVEMWTSSYPGMWNDARCDYYDYIYKNYVCKVAKGDMPSTPQMPTPGDQDCPSGNWDVWGDTCVLIRPNDYRTWDEALGLCRQMGGSEASLASIHSEEENWYLHRKVMEYNYDDYYNPDVWIGMYKLTYGYPYVWENELEVDFTNWAPGEPNDDNGSQNCVRLYHLTGEWDDYYCYEYYYHGYVCQTRAAAYQKELAEKGPDFFLKTPDDFPSHADLKAKLNLDQKKHRKPQPVETYIAYEPIDRAHPDDFRNYFHNEEHIHYAYAEQAVDNKGGKQAGIIIGCLVGVVAVAAVISIVVKRKVDKAAQNRSTRRVVATVVNEDTTSA